LKGRRMSHKFSVYVDEDQVDALDAVARDERSHRASVIRRAIDLYLQTRRTLEEAQEKR
jgi:metal-responsive CopG/Arc/MetJ family transcriptional regulator